MKGLDPTLRALLQCPQCAGVLSDRPQALHCAGCGQSWPVVKGVPLLVPEAKVAPNKRPRKGRG